MKIIIFNGPPGSGKDTAVEYAQKIYAAALPFSFKRKLIEITITIFGIQRDVWDSWYTREGKEIPREELGGLSCRSALIYVSEEVIKPAFGKDYFGQQEALFISQALDKDYKIAMCSDGGFVEETIPLIERFGLENIYVVYLYRDNFSFKNDSRKYLPEEMFCRDNIRRIYNNYTMDYLYSAVKYVIKDIIKK